VISTGIAVAVPEGCYGRIAPRSGLAAKHGIDVLAGVVDRSYRGALLVVLLNTGSDAVRLDHGERIAQLIIERCETPAVELVEDLDATERGANGFGSSGR
jgi:dUTP pyrophosphatase